MCVGIDEQADRERNCEVSGNGVAAIVWVVLFDAALGGLIWLVWF